jgi:hypothetical protein
LIPPRLRIAAIALLLCGCRSARAGTVPVDDAQQPPSFYCERSHTNHAWSYQHRGIYVDPRGTVFRFEHGRGEQALLQVPVDSVTEQALLARYAPGQTQIGTIQPMEMAERYRQAREAGEGTLTERRRRGADMGATVTRCFLPDAAGVYREVLLRQRGDWERENRSPAATQLSAWLDSLALRAR